MTFTATEKDYFVGIWMVGGPSTDWMAVLKLPEEGPAVLEYRFRYYDPEDPGNDPFSGKDEKRFYCVKAAGREEVDLQRLREAADCMAGVIADLLETTVSYVPVDGGVEKFVERLSAQPWAHVKKYEKVGTA